MSNSSDARQMNQQHLKQLASCDLPGNKIHGGLKLCAWGCGRTTRNHSGIGDQCCRNREAIYQARKAEKAAKRPNPKRQAASAKANAVKRVKLTAELAFTEFSEAGK